MMWISKHPPIYVWEQDDWYNEIEKIVYKPDIKQMIWYNSEGKKIPFTKKTKLMDKK